MLNLYAERQRGFECRMRIDHLEHDCIMRKPQRSKDQALGKNLDIVRIEPTVIWEVINRRSGHGPQLFTVPEARPILSNFPFKHVGCRDHFASLQQRWAKKHQRQRWKSGFCAMRGGSSPACAARMMSTALSE